MTEQVAPTDDEELILLEPRQTGLILEPGQVAIVVGEKDLSLTHEIVFTSAIEDLFENGDDEDEVPLHVELAMALVFRLRKDPRFSKTCLNWYRKHQEDHPEDAHGLEPEWRANAWRLRRGQAALIVGTDNETGVLTAMALTGPGTEDPNDPSMVSYGLPDALVMELMSRVRDEKFVRKVMGIKEAKV
jgi:hypothetical protein